MGWRLQLLWAWLRAHPKDTIFGLLAVGTLVVLLVGVVIFTGPSHPTGQRVVGEITSIRGHTDDTGITTYSVFVALDGGSVVGAKSRSLTGLAVGKRVTLVEYEQALSGTRSYRISRPSSP